MRVNLHTHTTRCGHARGTEEEYVLAALKNGFDALGFCDHTPFPEGNPLNFGGRMSMAEFPAYLSVIGSLREKYRGRIRLHTGLECEPLEWLLPLLRELRPQVEYMILGYHGNTLYPDFHRVYPFLTDAKDFRLYVDDCIRGMETGLFLYMAHPDLVLSATGMTPEIRALLRELCRAARALKVPLEYNTSGFTRRFAPGVPGYPAREFWELAAEEGVSCVVGVDAHDPARLNETELFDRSKLLVKNMGVTLIDNPETLL